ncbi:hypothetical protein E6H13_01225 [Candidatus Bathyarchaeota archaeon]|nr:MAG: hypothetical protein E6H13_01225 [Candidatus Bathyarchaeota archaeon]
MPRLFLFGFVGFVVVAAYMSVAPFLGLPYVRLVFNELGFIEYFLIAMAGVVLGGLATWERGNRNRSSPGND